MQTEITLATGREIRLNQIRQVHTYEGVLEGNPPYISTRILARVKESYHYGKDPVVIIPEGHEYLKETDPMKNRRVSLDHLCPSPLLPDICCSAIFRSSPLDPDEDWAYSQLALIWFQDGFDLCEGALHQIRHIDWESNCVEGGY